LIVIVIHLYYPGEIVASLYEYLVRSYVKLYLCKISVGFFIMKLMFCKNVGRGWSNENGFTEKKSARKVGGNATAHNVLYFSF